jgi:hypothetical protein
LRRDAGGPGRSAAVLRLWPDSSHAHSENIFLLDKYPGRPALRPTRTQAKHARRRRRRPRRRAGSTNRAHARTSSKSRAHLGWTGARGTTMSASSWCGSSAAAAAVAASMASNFAARVAGACIAASVIAQAVACRRRRHGREAGWSRGARRRRPDGILESWPRACQLRPAGRRAAARAPPRPLPVLSALV